MSTNGAFDRLTSNLGQNERIKLLEKIKSHTDMSERPLNTGRDAAAMEKAEDSFEKLSLLKRFVYFIIGFFTGKAPIDVHKNRLIAEMGRSIDLLYAGMYDWQQGFLRLAFQDELKRLRESARFFYSALDSSVNRDRGAFFVFLGSVEMQELHALLVAGTDPEKFMQEHPGLADVKIRQMVINFIDMQVDAIAEAERTLMYDNARSLLCLKQLSSFLFDRLIMSFNQTAQEAEAVCPGVMVKNQLVSLNNILFSIKKTPSITLLSAMFFFIMNEHENEQGFDIDTEMQKFTAHAEKAVEVIRTFNHRVPLTRVLRCVLRDTAYQPLELTGGEDWLALYRKSWTDSATKQFDEYFREKRRARVQQLYSELFGTFILEPFENVQDENNEDGIPVENILVVSLLLIFHKLVFMPVINVYIRPILIDGDFVKKENKTEFTEGYNVLIKLDDTIKTFMARLAAGGDYGKRWDQIITDVQSVTVRKRKTNILMEEINSTIQKITEDAKKAMVSMEKILSGIITPQEGGLYNTLTNLAKISGKGTTFMDGLKDGLAKLRSSIVLVDEAAKLDLDD